MAEADIQLSIIMSGLYTLSRGKPGDPGAASTDVLLVDARRSALKGLPRHVPRLTVDIRHVDPASDPADTILTLPDGSSYAVWNLEGVDVQLPGHADSPSLTTVESVPANVRAPAGEAERRDLRWVASLSRVGGGATLNPAMLSPKPPSVVASRVFLRHGSLSTERLATTSAGDLIEFPFVAPGESATAASFAQALAVAVRWRDDLRTSAEIRLVPFGRTEPRATVVLQPVNEPETTVTITNEPVSLGHRHGDDPALLLHWGALYDLAQSPPKAAVRRVPMASPGGGSRSLGGTHCPPDQLP